ncbi:hypothetical protein FHL15_007737 [Xylaria flabelliformis]|uniref:RNase MRP protein 1 RNA binding domain-containing protein n=1 Tax=Xylaria flabelliformis TaxID=2512241 RepID=A0A553HTN6_9PEZI|nr:hypothetical protein FHL15_007737 [Xylaria flabelliformis]
MATQKRAGRDAQISTQTSSNASTAGAETQEATPYSQALSRLEPLQPVLAGLAHRNHNQHRRAAWWRCFGMLRRSCAKLVEKLVVAIAAAHRTAARAAKAAKAKSKKRRREELASGASVTVAAVGANDALVVRESHSQMDIITSHAAWLHDVLAPRCYLAFSQLAADNQFAALGVVLLGILAQVKAACDCVAPRSANPLLSPPSACKIPAAAAAAERKPLSVESPNTVAKIGSTATTLALDSRLTARETPLAPKGQQESQREATRGIGGKAISREDVERAAEQRKRKETREAKDIQPTTNTSHAKTSTPVKEETSTSSGRRLQVPSAQVENGDEGARPAKKMKTAQITKENARGESNDNDKNKKKRKKVKKSDEFDNLFKGLF